MTNGEDPDQTAPQTAPQGESDQSLHCFVSSVCPNT